MIEKSRTFIWQRGKEKTRYRLLEKKARWGIQKYAEVTTHEPSHTRAYARTSGRAYVHQVKGVYFKSGEIRAVKIGSDKRENYKKKRKEKRDNKEGAT